MNLEVRSALNTKDCSFLRHDATSSDTRSFLTNYTASHKRQGSSFNILLNHGLNTFYKIELFFAVDTKSLKAWLDYYQKH